MVHEVRLTLKKRAYPSQGRVRFNIAHLTVIGIREGEHVDLVNEATKKSITATVIADTVVRPGQVRLSEEDLKILGLQDDDEILVRKTPPRQEKIKKDSESGETAGQIAVEVKVAAQKTAGSLKKDSVKASAKAGTIAAKTVSKAKKQVKKVP